MTLSSISFTLAEAKEVIAFPLVDRYMRRRLFDVVAIEPNPSPWIFQGQERRTAPFQLLHAVVAQSVLDALIVATDRDLQRFLILLKMTDTADRAPEHSLGVATAVENYAVRMQFGQEGLDSYRAFQDKS